VINSVTKSFLRCHLCNATSKDFNNIDLIINKEVNASNMRFGISSLHAWIRFFECFLHIGYKLGIGKWQARIEDEKKIIADRKKAIQKRFKDMLGLNVDFPKQRFGSTNDGNTARRSDFSSVPVYLWTDSMVTLGWIQGYASRWKTYVANRVAEIQSLVPTASWNHLPGKFNPADCASRGLLPSKLVDFNF